MTDPLHNRLDQLGERFRDAPFAPAPSEAPALDAFLADVRRKSERRASAQRRLAIAAFVAAAACFMLALVIPALMPRTNTTLAPEQPRIAHATPTPASINRDSIAAVARSLALSNDYEPSADAAHGFSGSSPDDTFYAASSASAERIDQILANR